jgi:excisionase family DNA binding protein
MTDAELVKLFKSFSQFLAEEVAVQVECRRTLPIPRVPPAVEQGASAQPNIQTTAASQLLTIKEFSKEFRVSRSTVYRLINTGELTACKIGRGTRLRRDDVLRWARGLPRLSARGSAG